MLRSLFAIISGLFAMMIVVTFAGIANAKLFPPMPGTQPAAALAALPQAAKLLIVAGNCLGPMIGAAVAARIATPRLMVALLIGAAATVFNFENASGIPYPTWMFWTVTLLPLPLAGLAARWLGPVPPVLPEPKAWPKDAKSD